MACGMDEAEMSKPSRVLMTGNAAALSRLASLEGLQKAKGLTAPTLRQRASSPGLPDQDRRSRQNPRPITKSTQAAHLTAD